MNTVLCYVSEDMADFEVTLTLHLLRGTGGREIVAVGNDLSPVVSQAGFTDLPKLTLKQAFDLPEVEALVIPGGPIRVQPAALSSLICKLHQEKKLLAAICFGPQHFGRAGILDQHRFTTSCSQDHIRSLQVPDPYPWANYVEERVVRDGNVITAKGGAFVDFAFAICDYLNVFAGKESRRESLYREIMNR